MKREFSGHSSENTQNFMKILSVGAVQMRLLVALRNFGNTPKNYLH